MGFHSFGGRRGIGGQYTCVTMVRSGSFKRYYHTKEEATEEAKGIQHRLMKEGKTGRVQVLASMFVRKINHHWTKKDIIAFLNGDFGWTTIYDVSITGGKVIKFIDKVNQKRNYATLEEFTTPIVNPTPPMKNGLEIIQNNESLFELCKRAPTPTAFKMALRKIDMLKAPITSSVAQYVWRVTHED